MKNTSTVREFGVKIASLLLLFTVNLDACADLKLPALIDDNMVLQRETTITVWGEADPNEKVKLECGWSKKGLSTKADAEGKWAFKVATPEAGGPYKINISTSDERIELRDILIGDVWFCSGQSNMEIPVMGYNSQPVMGSMSEISIANPASKIRLFNVKRKATAEKDQQIEGEWKKTNPSDVAKMSALAYYFGKQINTALDIPIGLINCSWGGSSILGWMSEEAIVSAIGKEKRDILAGLRNDIQSNPSWLYNGMLEPATDYAIKGFLWYQGESNLGRHDEYKELLKTMVGEWRGLWGDADEDLGFYFVQLAPFAYGDSNATTLPLFVEAQQEAEKQINNCYMATTTDVGDADCVHPSNKKAVAERMAALALNNTYKVSGMEMFDYPKYESVRFDGANAIVKLNSGPLGLAFGEVVGFELAGEDRVFYPAKAIVDIDVKDIVTVSSDKVSKPVAVRYAFKNFMDNNLKSTLGVIAPSFRSDNW